MTVKELVNTVIEHVKEGTHKAFSIEDGKPYYYTFSNGLFFVHDHHTDEIVDIITQYELETRLIVFYLLYPFDREDDEFYFKNLKEVATCC